MRNLVLSVFMLMSCTWVSAQTTPMMHEQGNTVYNTVNKSEAIAFTKAKASNSKDAISEWFSLSNGVTPYVGEMNDLFAFTIFPDTTMLSGGDGRMIFMNSSAVTIDPISEIWDLDENTWNENTSYSIDSVAVGYVYTRNTSSDIVDTLVIQIQTNDYVYNLKADERSWVSDLYSVDKMSIQIVYHGDKTWDARGVDETTVLATIKVPLTEAEESTDPTRVSYIQKALSGIVVGSGKTIGISMTFLPGYTWTPNTDSVQMYNTFKALSYGNQSVGQFPMYFENDYNASSFMRAWAFRPGNDEAYESVYFFTNNPFPYQYNDIQVCLTALNTGIDNAVAKNVSVEQNRPNPFRGTTTIDYSLEKASKVVIDVYDATGSLVKSINEGVEVEGSHSAKLNCSNLQSGVYYYSLTTATNKVTKKMIVY